MTTASDILTRASRRIGTLPGEESLTSAEAADALDIMNTLMQGFGPMGIYYVHSTLALTNTVNMPDELIRPLILMVASELADEFGMQLTPKLMADIEAARSTLQAHYFLKRPGVIDPAIKSQIIGRFNITTGE